MPLLLRDFAAALDDAAATTSKLAKQKRLAELFRTLDRTDLSLAIRYSIGRPFEASDERVLGVSSRIVSDVALQLTGASPADYRATTIQRGEIGEALSDLWPKDFIPVGEPLTLRDMAAAFDRLAATTQPMEKRPIVLELFSRCETPREACYLAKVILSDLRTGVREGIVQAAVAETFAVPLADVLRAQLLQGDLEHAAALAAEGRLAEAKFTLFHPMQFMLAQPIEGPEDAPGDWQLEDKLDGIRTQAHKQSTGQGDRIALYTRTMDRTDESFPDVVAQLAKVAGDWLIDGEIVPWRNGRALPFAQLQKRLGRKKVPAKVLREHPAVLIAFDLLYLNGRLLMDEPLRERRRLLVELASQYKDLIVLPETEATHVEAVAAAFEAARAAGNEGLMLKDPNSPYTPGRRGGAWLKLKSHLPTLDCVVTAAEYGHGKRRGSLSDYTFAVRDGDRLVNLAKAYSGVTDAEIAELTTLFKSIALSDNGRVFQVKPQLVMELAFDQITESERHASGFALRFPRIKRIRYDKGPGDIDTLERVREIYHSAGNLGRKLEPVADLPEPTLFDGF